MNLPASSRPALDSDLSDAPADSERVPRKRTKLRKEEIIQEATRLFAERGYEGASMGDLAERVGLRKASLFHHFPSKDALYAAVVGQLIERIAAEIGGALSREQPFLERMDDLNDRVTTIFASDPCAARVLLREMLDYGPVMREALGTKFNEMLKVSKEFAETGKREGHVDASVDSTQLVVSHIGLHLAPFSVLQVVENFTGLSPFSPEFLEQRKRAVREQSRRLLGIAPR